MLGPLDGQARGEGRARTRRALPAKRAAVLLDDLPRDVEAQPCALGLRGEELLEEALAHVGRDAGAGVANGDLHLVVHAPGAHRELPAAAQRLEPVLDE